MILSCWIFHLTCCHLDPITATSLDHTSTLIQNNDEQTKQRTENNAEESNESPNVQLVTTDIKSDNPM